MSATSIPRTVHLSKNGVAHDIGDNGKFVEYGGATALDFQAYLCAKQSVDDRALHLGLYAQLRTLIAAMPMDAQGELRVLEVGCGVGAMIERAERWGLWQEVAGSICYMALDQAQENLDAIAPTRNSRVQIEPVCAEFHAFANAAIASGDTWDLLVASAVLDLFNLSTTLPLIRDLLRPKGVAWLTLNFDGSTILQPTIDREFDALIEARYHRTMDQRMKNGVPSGDSQTGRHLYVALPAAGLEIVAAGASDWTVFPIDGDYIGDEARFLHFIVDTMHGALANDEALDPVRFAAWIAQRKQQIDRRELIYLAKQYDFLVQRSS